MTQTQELTDRQYDIADAICEYVNARESREFNASQLARVAKCATHEAYPVIRHLVAQNEIAVMYTTQRGHITRVAARRAGHYNPGTV